MKWRPYYKLDDVGEPVICEDILEWAAWFATTSHESRVVAKTEVGDTTVSTVFLGVDHSFREGDPVLWETMMFGGQYDLACDRYRSKREALIGHEKWVLVAEGKMTPIDARMLREGFPRLKAALDAPADETKKKKEQS